MNFMNTFTGLVTRFRGNQKLNILKCVILVLFISTGESVGQLAGFSYINYPESTVKDVDGNQEFSNQEFSAFVNIPMRLKNNKTVMVHGIEYGYVEANRSDSLLITDESTQQFHVITYSFILSHKWNEKWSFVTTIKPTIASDFKEKISRDDFILQGATMVSKKVSDKFRIGGGLAFTTRYGKPRVLPIIPIQYQKNKHRLKALLPVDISYLYQAGNNGKLNIGLRAAINGAYFNITAPEYSGAGIPQMDKINYSRVNIGPVIRYQLTKIIRFEAFGGISVNRKFNLVDSNEKEYEADTKNGPFFKIGFSITPPGN